MAKTDKAGSIVNLYWVTTDDHDEDWLILARTIRTAESYHTQYEGYEPGEARAELILRAGTDPIPGPIPRHAQLEDLQMLGFEILNPDPNGRCVRRTSIAPSRAADNSAISSFFVFSTLATHYQ